MAGGVRVPNDLIGIDDLHLAAAPTTLASSLRIGGMLFRGTSPHFRYSLCGKCRLGQHRLVRVVLARCGFGFGAGGVASATAVADSSPPHVRKKPSGRPAGCTDASNPPFQTKPCLPGAAAAQRSIGVKTVPARAQS